MPQEVDVYIVADEPAGEFNVSYFATIRRPTRDRRVIAQYPAVPEDRLAGIHEVCRASTRRPERHVLEQLGKIVFG
ncbi:MAG TPA: hypothetical protein VJA47_00740 [archaeon]|nr:hypothetical protein [archaeon]